MELCIRSNEKYNEDLGEEMAKLVHFLIRLGYELGTYESRLFKCEKESGVSE